MRLIVVDDEQNNLDAFEMETEDIKGIEIIGKFRNPKEALQFAEHNAVDLAVLDVEMPGMNGILLGHKLRECCADIALVYVTAYKEYAFEAFQLEACAYILKPFNRADIEKAILRAAQLSGKEEVLPGRKEIFIRTFGRFEVFVDGKPIEFKSSKAKELMALLVDRQGGIVTTEEALTYLWEDKPDNDSNRSLCRKVMQRLHNNLEQYGIDDIIVRHSRGRSLETSKVACDYYQYLDEGNEEGKPAFYGEYMTNYSWAEETLSRLLEYEDTRGGV